MENSGQDNVAPIIDVEKIDEPKTEPAQISSGEAGKGGGEARKKVGSFESLMWWAIVAFSAFWIVFPEPTDAFPVIGWLDEFTAMGILVMGLNRLGIKIPLLDRIFNKRFESSDKGDKGDKPAEKDVTPTPPATKP